MANFCSGQLPVKDSYLGQAVPGNMPKLFPLSVRKGLFAAERIAISNDGREIYYSEIEGYYPLRGTTIMNYRFTGDKWTGPFKMFEGCAPALSVTGDTMFFERNDIENNPEIYMSVKTGTKWSRPKRILAGINRAHYLQQTGIGDYYISSAPESGEGKNDWCRVLISKADTIVQSLGKPLNNIADNLDYYIACDKSYIIITGPTGLAVSFSEGDGMWSKPVNLGKKINFGLGMWGPWVTQDNKYLFYSTGTKQDYSDVGIFWVRIDNLLDSLKNTINVPLQ
ncbi:MAG TPA: hypothetical protein VHO46_11880 [Bacteroidales bacterium]|nr:hypothetical protein [Bacteroidales bacterium]